MSIRNFFVRLGASGRLSYANIMATLAFFLALGGGAYAATSINGKRIAKHSIPANRLVRGAVVPRAAVADQVEHLLITRGRRRRAHRHAAELAQASGGSSTVVELSVGQSATLFQVGPFTVTAKCVDDGNGAYDEYMYGSATVDWYNGGTHVNAGDTSPLGHTGATSSQAAYTNTGIAMVGLDGESLTIGTYTETLHELGDCSFSGSAVG